MSSADQKITEPTPEDLQRLELQRGTLERYIDDESSFANYQKTAGKLGLIRTLLEESFVAPEQKYEVQCMGVVLGDAFVEHLGFEWVIVEDAHGRDAAIRLPGTSIILFPLTMISKRIERGESVDVFDLFNGVVDEVDRIRGFAD